MARVRRFFDGTGPYSGIGLVAWLAGLIGLMSVLLSTNGLGWWLEAQSTQGHEQGGLVTYSVGGTNYVVDDLKALASAPPQNRTVWYLPSEPANGELSNSVNQWIDWSITVGPGLVGGALIAIGFAQRRRRSKGPVWDDPKESYGRGIPSETIQAILAQHKKTS